MKQILHRILYICKSNGVSRSIFQTYPDLRSFTLDVQQSSDPINNAAKALRYLCLTPRGTFNGFSYAVQGIYCYLKESGYISDPHKVFPVLKELLDTNPTYEDVYDFLTQNFALPNNNDGCAF